MSDVRCWYPGFEWMSGRSACGIDYVANSGPIAARVEDAQCRACLRSDLARGALEAHRLAQFDIQERERKIADQDERIRALTASASDSGCRCGCRSTGQTDQIAELYRQISTIEAELKECKGQAMVWESDQLIIAELQQQIEKLAAENLELEKKATAYCCGSGQEMSKGRDAAIQSNADLLVGLSERLATIQELNNQIKRLQGIIQGAEGHHSPLESELKQCQATLTREREENVRTLNAAASQYDEKVQMLTKTNQIQVERIDELMERVGMFPKGHPKALKKEEYNQIAVDMAQRAMDDLTGAQQNCCDDARIHHSHCECAGCGGRRDVGEEVDASFEATPELVSDQRAKGFECECPYHSCALATVFYGHCQICGGEWIPF